MKKNFKLVILTLTIYSFITLSTSVCISSEISMRPLERNRCFQCDQCDELPGILINSNFDEVKAGEMATGVAVAAFIIVPLIMTVAQTTVSLIQIYQQKAGRPRILIHTPYQRESLFDVTRLYNLGSYEEN